MHSVRAQQATVDLLNSLKSKYGEDWVKVSLDLHSCGLSAETWSAVEVRDPRLSLDTDKQH